MFAQTECCSFSASSSIAGLKKLIEQGEVDKDEHVVCVTTGHGLKDPDTAVKICKKPVEVEAKMEAIEKILGLKKTRSLVVSGTIS